MRSKKVSNFFSREQRFSKKAKSKVKCSASFINRQSMILFTNGFASHTITRRRSTDERISLSPFHAGQIDPPQQHRQFVTANFGALLVCRDGGELKRPLFQSTVPDRKTITVPVENLELVTAAVDKQKQMTGKRILLQQPGHQALQPIESFSNIGGTRCEINPRSGRKIQHDTPSSAESLIATSAR